MSWSITQTVILSCQRAWIEGPAAENEKAIQAIRSGPGRWKRGTLQHRQKPRAASRDPVSRKKLK